jgi:microcystin-dependent protein
MSEPFLAEIRIFGFNFAPRGWATCDGQILPINQNQALYSLLGTTYGGDGRTTFGLPELRGRVPLHEGSGTGLSNRTLGAGGGIEQVTLTTSQMPSHLHTLQATTNPADSRSPSSKVSATAIDDLYGVPEDLVNSASGAVAATGGNQAHQNMQPYLVLNFCIALQGLFPSRN